MDTLTATLSGGRLTFSRRVFLGATYTLAFAGDAASLTGLTLYVTDREGKIAYSTSVTANGTTTLAFTSTEMADMFGACGGESIGFQSWLANGTATIGYGTLSVIWSPLIVDIATGTAAAMKGDTGVGIASIIKNGTNITFTLTNNTTTTVSIADLKGDKGDTGNVLNASSAALVAAMPLFSEATASIDDMFAQVEKITNILKAMNT